MPRLKPEFRTFIGKISRKNISIISIANVYNWSEPEA
jgi:hypothetical protein